MRVLIIDDSPHDRERIVRELQKELGGSEFVEVSQREDFDAAVARGDFDVVLTDCCLHWTDGLRILKTIQGWFSHIPVVMVTGAGDEEIAVEGMKSGLSDYVLKGHLQRLPAAVKESLERSRRRKEYEEAFRQLKVSKERYHIISELTSDYAYSLHVEPDGTLVPEWVTEAFTHISGYVLEEMVARGGWQILIHPEDLPSVRQHFDRVLAGRAEVTEFRIVARGGEVRWLRNFNRPVWDEGQGHVVRIHGATQDITERKRAEEEVRLLQTMTLAINKSEGLHDALLVVLRKVCHVTGWVFGEAWVPRPDGTLLEQSPAWYSRVEELERFRTASEGFTFPPGKGLPGRAWSSKQPVWMQDVTADPDFLRASIAREVGLKAGMAIPVLANDEVVAVITFYGIEAREEDERLVGLVSAVADQLGSLIQRKRAEEEKERIQSQLFQSQRMESIGRLAGGVAHDFNNLLTIIQGQADRAMRTLGEDEPLYENLEEIRRASIRAADLTRRLLLFSRKQPMEFASLDLGRMVEVWLKMLQRLLGEDIAIQPNLASDLWTVQADAGSIEQVILNLVLNARDAMPEGGTLTIRTGNVTLDEEQCHRIPEAWPGRFVCLSVVDTGVGMDPELIPQIFEPFFTTKEAGKGTGLGLSVAYGIVKRHEGWIHVSSEPGQGSTFTIYLPAFAGKPEEKAQETVSFQELRGEGERVLLVEDEEEVRGFVARVLRENGYVVWEAASGGEALDRFERERGAFDLLFSDVILPDRSGLQLVDQLRFRNPELRVLLGSGYLDQKSQEPTIHARGFRFIQKPYALPELLRVVREVIGGERGKVREGPVWQEPCFPGF
ncbi:MAG: response regulator [Candidatus Tectomicrobia bacterium]|uniref:histidine kinase n=1 Tax=Tectimicrobiota bacterium TaxID=2528274 RepID=A0A932CT05_UNCTE|nr:response regulator [Candidatus Tectomicrobia bacterium]